MIAVFSVSREHSASIFEGKRNVFVKYTNFGKLTKDSKIVFYISKEKILIGEGKIEKIYDATPDAIWARFGEQIFLDYSQYVQYTTVSPVEKMPRKKQLLKAFVLKEVRKYKQEIEWKHGFAPSGCYLAAEEYSRMVT